MKKILLNWVGNYRLHIFLWLAFITYETVLVWIIFGASSHPLVYAVHYALAILLFYMQAYRALPWALQSQKNAYIAVPILILLEMAGFIILSFWGDKALISSHILLSTKGLGFTYQYCLKTIYRGILFIGASTGYYYVIRYNAEKRKSEELERLRLNNIIQQQKSEKELIKAQNAYLKAQINPHFLFNTLDFIYHNIASISPTIGEAVVTLADMMRYAIDSDKMGDFIDLSDEIEQVEHFLYLSQIRKKGALPVKLIVDGQLADVKFIPLVLLTLTENIFKHGDLSRIEDYAFINIYVKDYIFYIETDNLIDKKSKSESSHTGLTNLYNRLVYAFGDGVNFKYGEDDRQHFMVSITIPLNLLND